jgi:hypothetical protein
LREGRRCSVRIGKPKKKKYKPAQTMDEVAVRV